MNTLLSTFWWMDNVVYWENYGCQHENKGDWEWVQPCPAAVMCSWIKMLDSDTQEPFCNKDPAFRKPV